MAAKQEVTVSLKIFVDREKQRVVFAESDKHFVDILLSFLTLPMGTIVRLLGKQSPEPARIGCMNNLYESVSNLSTETLWTDSCKLMLLQPINIWEPQLKNLKVNVDDSEPIKYFKCSNVFCSCNSSVSNYMNARCRSGKLMTMKMELMDSVVNRGGNEEVFITGVPKFIISDDLQVMHSAPGAALKLLRYFGLSDVRQLDERSLNVGLKDIADLLKHSLISKSPLTELFLPRQGSNSSNPRFGHHNQVMSQNFSNPASTANMISVKVFSTKSNNRVVYAEAREDFVDFLFTFLTLPLASLVNLLGGESGLGSIDNLYRSVTGLDSDWFVQLQQEMLGVEIRYENTKDHLLHGGVAPPVSCRNQLLNIREEAPLQYYCFRDKLNVRGGFYLRTSDLKLWEGDAFTSRMTLINPKAPTVGFVRKPSLFMVSDDLRVTPLSSYSVSSLMSLEFLTDDLEERVISIGVTEAMNLLKASLISTTALTDGLNLLLKKPKLEK